MWLKPPFANDFRRADRKHERGPDVVAEALVIDAVSPGLIPLPGSCADDPFELLRDGGSDSSVSEGALA